MNDIVSANRVGEFYYKRRYHEFVRCGGHGFDIILPDELGEALSKNILHPYVKSRMGDYRMDFESPSHVHYCMRAEKRIQTEAAEMAKGNYSNICSDPAFDSVRGLRGNELEGFCREMDRHHSLSMGLEDNFTPAQVRQRDLILAMRGVIQNQDCSRREAIKHLYLTGQLRRLGYTNLESAYRKSGPKEARKLGL